MRSDNQNERIINVTGLHVSSVRIIYRAKQPRDFYAPGYPISISKDITKYDAKTLVNNLGVALADIEVDETEIQSILGLYVTAIDWHQGSQ